jgi:hypothetical protein
VMTRGKRPFAHALSSPASLTDRPSGFVAHLAGNGQPSELKALYRATALNIDQGAFVMGKGKRNCSVFNV